MSEATDPLANPSVEGGWHYEASENGVIDYAQLAIEQARNAYFEKYGKRLSEAEKAAKQWTVKKVVDQ